MIKHFIQNIIHSIIRHRGTICISLIFLGIATIYMWPMLQRPFFNLIDDGWSLFVAKHTVQASNIHGWVDQLIVQEASIGRVRPLYYLYYIFIWVFSGSNPLAYWVAQTILISCLFVLLYFVEKPTTGVQKLFRLICISCILFFPSLVTNYFRLGTAEPRQVLLLLLFIIWLFSLEKYFKNKIFLITGVLIYLGALLTKETSLSLFPATLIQLLFIAKCNKHQQKTALWLCVVFSIISIFFLGLFVKIGSTGYGSGAALNFSVMKSNFLSFRVGHRDELLLLAFSTFILLTHVFQNLKSKRGPEYWMQTYQKTAIYFSILIGQLFFLLIWSHQLERYFLIFDVLLVLLFLHSTSNFLTLSKKISRNQLLVFGSGFFCWSIVWFIGVFKGYVPNPGLKLQNSLQARREAICSYQENGQLIEYLLSKDHTVANIYILHNDYEVIYEINLFATKFDPSVNLRVFSSNKDVVHDFSSKFPQLTFSSDLLRDFSSDRNKKKIMLARSEAQAESLPTPLLKNSFVLRANHSCEKQLNWVIWE